MAKPRIIVNELDYQRIEKLLGEPQYADLETAEALLEELERAEVLPPERIPPKVVTLNSRVRFKDLASGRESERVLVYPSAVAGRPDHLSVLAPVGCALLGLSEGQEIDWTLPGGTRTRLQVEEVLYQPEAAGEYHR